MKTINEVLDNYTEIYRVAVDDMFGYGLCRFLTVEQAKKIGFTTDIEHEKTHEPLEWNEENIINQLAFDVIRGYQLANKKEYMLASIMFMSVLSWCKVLENKYANYDAMKFITRPKDLFKKLSKLYNFELKMED